VGARNYAGVAVKDGYLEPSEAPGLGVELTKKKWPGIHMVRIISCGYSKMGGNASDVSLKCNSVIA
jgi:hypothetical protein